MTTKARVKVAVGVVVSFVALVAAIIYMSAANIVTFEMAKLMLVALLGMYVGFGFLIAVYLVIRKWE